MFKWLLLLSLVHADTPPPTTVLALKPGSCEGVVVSDGSTLSCPITLPVIYGGTGSATANGSLNSLLPVQTGNTGKYLTTNGSNTSWANALSALTGDVTVSGTGSQAAVVNSIAGAVPATTNTINTIVKRDGSGAFAGSLTGAASLNVLKTGDTMSGTLDMGAQKVTTTYVPVNASDLVNKTYADNISQGLSWKDVVEVATTGALPSYVYANGTLGVGATITASVNGALPAQDGVILIVNDRLLVKNESSQQYNGIYTVTAVGSAGAKFVLTRAIDADQAAELAQATVQTSPDGTTQSGFGYRQSTSGTLTVGTSNIVWTNFTIGTSYTFTSGTSLTGSTVSAAVDNSTIDITGNNLEVKTGGISNAQINASAGIVDTKLATISTASKVSNSATTATSANTVSTIVSRDGSGNFSAGTITATLTGHASLDLPLTGGTLTGQLLLPASTTSIGTAPMKIATGILQSTAQAGSIEYDGTNLYFTDATPTRRTLNFGSAGANATLSNLTSPTAINQNLIFSNSLTGPNIAAGDDNTNNGTKAPTLNITSGAKTAGTGDSGDINITLSNSSGGAVGNLNLSSGSGTTRGSVITSMNIIPDSDGGRSVGRNGSRFSTMNSVTISSDSFNASSDGTANGGLFKTASAPDGNSYNVNITTAAAGKLGLFTASDGANNSTATGNLLISSGNKTAGTGNSGDVIIANGTSAGGSVGKIKVANPLAMDGTTIPRVGTATLSGGTVTVSNSTITANTKIFLTAVHGAGIPLALVYVDSVSVGTNFVIKSTNIADTGDVNWFLVEKY